ncbi:ferredoxin--NADP reductase [Rhodococcus tibetensis]|uniref:Ferredoxin--NADP reductase n=1 Tax=Rhodococcus tibetensis TaxID=2965064 RepID=A0ABT1Q669_9NOCA|nr:ferredoxin--NADP reductase [Rhodococcus sp. FXJ9.536]MCQ4117752.1 ferredoxin--NADP reductase [Rhodococcus sp. FXJ9.536]
MTAPTIHRLRIAEVIEETADASSVVFDLEPHQKERFSYRPGQFLTLHIPHDGASLARCYSLASAPDIDNALKITVKRVDRGRGSNWLCDHARTGAEIEVLEPSGVFTPKSLDRAFLLIAGGSGITPVMSILKSVLGRGTGHIVLFYANRDEDSVIFRAELLELLARHPDRLSIVHWIESQDGLPTSDRLREQFSPLHFDEAFVCGPGPFMDCTRDALRSLNFPREKLHIERFNSLRSNPFESVLVTAAADPGTVTRASTVVVEKDGQTQTFSWPADQRLLDVLTTNGMKAPSSCSEGVCAACECRLTEGRVEMMNNQVLEDEDLAAGYILACQALPLTDTVRIAYDS